MSPFSGRPVQPFLRTRLAYRFVSGRPLDGKVRTDATWLRPATQILTPTGRASRWACLPGWKRQAWRLAPIPAAVAVAVAFVVAPAAARVVVLAGLVVVGGTAIRVGHRRWRSRHFRRNYVMPLARVIGPQLEIPPSTPVDKWLLIDERLAGLTLRSLKPPSPAGEWATRLYLHRIYPVVSWLPQRLRRLLWWARGKAGPVDGVVALFRRPWPERPPRVEIRVPHYLAADQQAAIARAIAVKLPLNGMTCTWDQIGPVETGTWVPRKRPPSKVGVGRVREHLNLPEYEFYVGDTTGGRPVIVSLNDDAPHVACSAGSGAGKSVLAQLFAVQVLRRGGRVVILDRKGSHRWALGLPGVRYCTQPGDMHDALIEAAELADSRNTQALTEAEGWDPGERVFVIFEEMNATMSALRGHWDDAREKGDPKLSPAIRAFRDIMFMGRSAKVNLFGVAQMLSAQTTGGPESRENFGIRCLARYTTNAWKMLVPECPMPRASATRGRWQVVIAGTATEVQVAYLTGAEARDVAGLSPIAESPPMGSDQAMSPGQEPIGDTPADPLSEVLTLRQAVDAGIVSGTFAAAKKRLQRAKAENPSTAPRPAGRAGSADTYRVSDLIEWSEPRRPTDAPRQQGP